jgi:hypothetical protein
MGLQNGIKLHATLSSVSINAVKTIARNYSHVFDGTTPINDNNDIGNCTVTGDNEHLRVVVDMNWIAYSKMKGAPPSKAVETCMAVLITFAKCGIIVYPVFDPPEQVESIS